MGNEDNARRIAAEIIEAHSMDELARMATDSVQPSWCLECGMEGPDLEPDAEGVKCVDCGAMKVTSLENIILMGCF